LEEFSLSQALNTKLSTLRLPAVLFQQFVSQVVDSDYAETIGRYIYKTHKDNRWTTVTRGDLTQERLRVLVARHLSQESYFTGVSCSDKTRHMILDLDWQGDEVELNQRCDRVISILEPTLGRPTVILRSSEKGGRHLRWLLNNPLDRQKLHNFVKAMLFLGGVSLRKGVVELFPGLKHKCIRLPLGLGGALLDDLYNVVWDESTPLAYGVTAYLTLCQVKVNALKLVTHPKWGLSTSNLKSLLSIAEPIPAIPLATNTPLDDLDPFQRVERVWLKVGLTNEKQKLRAITDLAIYNWHAGYTKVESTERIQLWLERAHNGKSKDFTANSEKELRITIPETVDFIYRSAEEQGFRRRNAISEFEQLFLAEDDIDRILKLTEDFDKQLWLFSLLTYIKTHQTGNTVVLHSLTVNQLRGCSMNSRTTLIEYAVELGLIEMVEDYDREAGKARLYKVNWAFNSENSRSFTSLERYLQVKYKYGDLVKNYNRYRAMAIRDYVDNPSDYSMIKAKETSLKQKEEKPDETQSVWELWQHKNSNGSLRIQS
jgi:hypothetical protein